MQKQLTTLLTKIQLQYQHNHNHRQPFKLRSNSV